MQKYYIGNLILGDELAIAQQLISDILTCFAADVLDRAPLVAEAPHMGASCRLNGGSNRCPIEASHKKEVWHRTEKKSG